MADELFKIDDAGKLQLHLHKFQWQTMQSQARVIVDLKGWRAGFSSFAPFWLKQEMERCGPGNSALNYFCAIPTLQAAKKGIIPYVRQVFETYYNLATFNKNDNVFFTTPEGERRLWGHAQKERTPINVVYADDPTSFGSMTSLGGIADEIGQKKFKLESWRTLMSRMATTSGRVGEGNQRVGMGFPLNMNCGRILAGSTVWNLGWLEDMWDEYRDEVHAAMLLYVEELKQADSAEERAFIKSDFHRRMYLGLENKRHFIRFDSTANPSFPQQEFEAAREELQDWFFDMRYRALFRKPAGVIYADWDARRHVVDAFDLPKSWPREVGVDFGKRNFYATLWARDPETDRHFLYASYHDSTKSNAQRAEDLLKLEPLLERAVAGQISEADDRMELMMGGLAAIAPKYKPLWPGINAMASAIKCNKVFVFRGACEGFEDEVRNYSRPVDERGTVDLDADPESKESYHWLDSCRYYGSYWFSALAANASMGVVSRKSRDEKPRPKTPRLDAVVSTPVAQRHNMALRAGGGLAAGFRGAIRARRYGLDDSCLPGRHLDIDLK